jgi:uncharacterized protein (DUF58 family)
LIIRSWMPVLVVVFLLGVMADQPWAIAFSVSIALIIASARYWQNHSLDKVFYTRRWRYRRGFSGEPLQVTIEIENRKLLPLSWLRIVDPWPNPVGPEDESILGPSSVEMMGDLVSALSLRWHERVLRPYTLLLRQRGVYKIGPARLESGDLFGLFDQQKQLPKTDLITVFPELLPMAALQLIAEDPFGDRNSPRRLFEDPNRPSGVRDYHPEDGFRHIHWPATARSGSLQVKVYQPVSARVMVICLNVSTAAQYWLGMDADVLEHLIKVAATLAFNGAQAGYAVGLVSNGCLAHSDQPFNIAPGHSPQQLALVLQALAGVTPFTTAPFERYLVHSMPRVPYGATLLIVTSVVTPQLSESLLLLRRYRTHTTLFSVSETPPPEIPGVRNIHIPYQRSRTPTQELQ